MVRRDPKELDPTESDTGRSWSLLSSGCERSRYQFIPNQTYSSSRTLEACLNLLSCDAADRVAVGAL